jgi:hypothetical protein
MTEQEVRTVARQSVMETLQLMGLDTTNPAELQRDFQFIRSWRQSTEAVKRQGLVTVTIIILTGLAGLVALWVRGGIR